MNNKKKFNMPHVFIILLIIMGIVLVLSYIIPAGTYDRYIDENGIEVIDPDSFKYIEQEDPIGFLDFFNSIYNGFIGGSTIMGTLLICSGILNLLSVTGTFAAGIHKLIGGSKGKELIVVWAFYTIFSIFGVLGYGEASFPFYAIATAVIMALGFDRVSGAAVIMVSQAAGFSSGLLNIFTTGLSQQIVGLPLFSGMGYRALSFAVFYIIGLAYTLSYCRRIRNNPQKSYVKDEYSRQLSGELDLSGEIGEQVPLTSKRIIALVAFALLIVIQGYGCSTLGWGMPELASIYIIFGIIIAIIFRIKPNDVCRYITEGAMPVIGPCFAIALARSVMELMNQAQIVDTMVKFMGDSFTGKSSMVTLLLILLFVTAFNFFVVSGTGKAMMMMPILSPLGKILGINQQVMVLAYQFGDGFTNYLWPAGCMVGCALCKLDYGAWFRFAYKIIGLQIIASYVMLVIADAINLGPF